jgi:hypothetical protein
MTGVDRGTFPLAQKVIDRKIHAAHCNKDMIATIRSIEGIEPTRELNHNLSCGEVDCPGSERRIPYTRLGQ